MGRGEQGRPGHVYVSARRGRGGRGVVAGDSSCERFGGTVVGGVERACSGICWRARVYTKRLRVCWEGEVYEPYLPSWIRFSCHALQSTIE